jgi:hypothetical protein
MASEKLNRRDFTRLTAAAFGGLVAGTVLSGCGNRNNGSGATVGGATGAGASPAAAGEAHACKGLNGCQGQGAGGNNGCAGQGGCATASMHHECKGHNECKGQGGCGEMAGKNECKGHGGCAVPMKDEAAWKKARETFEAKMKATGKAVGSPPA